jgi:long-chain acyl-CoA synthetase
MGFTSEERFLIILPMAHVYALSGCVNSGLIRGATLVILERYTPRPIFAALESERITVLSAVPAVFELLARFPKKERYDLSALRLCVTGGAFLPAAAQREHEAALGVQMVQGYGLSECLPVICNPPDGRSKPGTLGIPGRRDIHLRILGPGGEVLPPGEVGEIAVASPTTMQGYHELPEDTAAVLRDGWLLTGDRGSMDGDGFLYYHGLSKPILNVRGNKVDLEEVRSVLLRHPEVAAVELEGEGEEDPARFGVSPEIRAEVVLLDGQPVEAAELKAYLRRRLAGYKVPAKITVRPGVETLAGAGTEKGCRARSIAGPTPARR